MIKPLVRMISFCLMILCLGGLPRGLMAVYAQGPDDGGEPIVVVPAGRLSLTFEQWGYGIRQLNRKMEDLYYFIRLPGNFQILPTGNYLDLTTNHLPAMPNKPSVLKVIMNGRPLHAFSLTESNAVSNTVRINLPADVLQPGSNSIKISLDTSATCEDPGAIVDVFIDPTSTISFGYQQNPYPVDLSLYPFPFTETSLLQVPVTLVLPDHPASDDLTAAATIGIGLGQASQGTVALTAVRAGDMGPEIRLNHHLIVVGRPDDNALLSNLVLPLPIDETRLEAGQGVLEEIVSPWNKFRVILIVSGLDNEAVLKASHALNRQTHFLGMRGQVAVVTQVRTVPQPAVSRLPGITLESLGYEDQVFYGAQSQDYTYVFALPLGWQVQTLPFFVCRFSHAEILDPDASVIDIALNDVPIGSTLLNEDNTNEGELIAILPRHLLRTGRNRLQVGIEMNLPAGLRDKCRDLGDEQLWAVVSKGSEIFLPYNTVDLAPDLSLIPYPFSQSTGLDQTLFVLPDQPSPQVINDLVRLAGLLGSTGHVEHISVRVAYASEVDPEAWKDCHLILLGRPTENTLLRAANAYLPQPFVADSDVLEPLAIDDAAFLPDPERDAGLLEIIASPWNEKYSLLAITGTTDEGVQMAVQALLDPPNSLKGNLAVVEPALLPGEANQISTYAVDTRPPATVSDTAITNDTAAETDLIVLAERWWK